jgi:hypothetical protein
MTTLFYERFIQKVIDFSRLAEYSSVSIVEQYLKIDHQPKLAQINQLKAWPDQFRSLEPMIVAELKQRYDVRFTYNSNAIEGNTLTKSETELVLTQGITIGGKTLDEHSAFRLDF